MKPVHPEKREAAAVVVVMAVVAVVVVEEGNKFKKMIKIKPHISAAFLIFFFFSKTYHSV
jgi:hypothetical protein